MTEPKVLWGEYGDQVAWRIVGTDSHLDARGWYVASDESELREKALAQLVRFGGLVARPPVFDKVRVPLRAPQTGSETHGSVEGEGFDIEFGGRVPIEGEGTLDGLEVYYRARGHGWSLTVTLSDEQTWTYAENPYAWPDGGWLATGESQANILKAFEAFRTLFGNPGS